MGISNAHNLTAAVPVQPVNPYGVRLSLRRGDPFCNLLGEDWSRTHWYPTAAARDAALADMCRQHEYSRSGDAPALAFDKVENLAASRTITETAVQKLRPRNR
jgi:hypothetical protein